MRDFIELLLIILSIFLVLAGITAVIVVSTQPIRNHMCQARWEPYETKSNWSGDCRVGIMHDGQKIFVPEASVKFPRS